MSESRPATQCEVSRSVAGPRTAWRSKPAIVPVDPDDRSIERIKVELAGRYGQDYEVQCFTTAEQRRPRCRAAR
jgi:hypothetical protein